MSHISRSLLVWTSIATHDQLQSVTTLLAVFCLELEQFEQVVLLEVLLEVIFLVRIVVNGTHADALLVDLPSIDLLFDCSHRHESVNDYVFLLTNTEHSIDCLVVICRVPIGINDDCSISAG